MRAIIWDGARLRLVDDLEVQEPDAGEVKVRVLRSGICHSDLNMIDNGHATAPVVLGHEAGGVVAAVGPGVTGWSVGDPVMVGTQTPCGRCRECLRGTPANCDVTWGYVPAQPFRWRQQAVASFANVSSFAGEIVVKASQLYRTDGLAPEAAALIGCAVSTGCCAVWRLGGVGAGDRVLIIGIGGIGVNAIQGAQLVGATVIAADILPSKEAVARRFGASAFHRVDRGMDGFALAEALRSAFGPVDIAIECSGAPAAVEAAIHATKRGGRAVLIGMTSQGAQVRLSLDAVLGGREIVSHMNGGARPDRDYPELIQLARSGRIDVASQVTRVWPLEEFEEAIAALRAGSVTRAVLDHSA